VRGERRRAALEALAFDPTTPADVKLQALRDLRQLDLTDERSRWDFSEELEHMSDEEGEQRLALFEELLPHIAFEVVEEDDPELATSGPEDWPEPVRRAFDQAVEMASRDAERRVEERARVLATRMAREGFHVVPPAADDVDAAEDPSGSSSVESRPESATGLVSQTSAEVAADVAEWNRRHPQGRRRPRSFD